MMGKKQHDVRAVIDPTVGHELVDIALVHALFGIVDTRDALPLRIDNEMDRAASPDDQVGTCPKPACVSLEEAVAVTALRRNAQVGASEGTGQQPRHVCLKENVHFEQKGVTLNRTAARLLVPVIQKEACKRQKLTPSRVRSIEHDEIPAQGAGRHLRDVCVGEAQFAQDALVVGSPGKAGQLADGRPHDLIERDVRRARVEPAGQLLRRDCEGRELPCHIEAPAQRREVVLLVNVLLRYALAHCVGELGAEQADQQFQDRVALRAELRNGPDIDADVPRHGQHVDQPVAQRGIVDAALARAFDFRQNFKLAVGRSDDPYHAAGAKPFSAVFKHAFTANP